MTADKHLQRWPRWTVACPEYVIPASYASEQEAIGMAAVIDSHGKCPYEHHAVLINSIEELRAMRQRRDEDEEQNS